MSKVKTMPENPFAFDDRENATAIEMVGRVYKKIEELIDGCNQFVETVSQSNTEFQAEIVKNINESAVALRQEFQDFIDTVSLDIEHFKSTAKEEIKAEIEIPEIPDLHVPTKLSELENDVGFITLDDMPETTTYTGEVEVE